MDAAPNSLISHCADQLEIAIESLIGLDCEVIEVCRPGAAVENYEVYSAMNLDGDLPGCIMIGLSRELAANLVSEMLMAEPEEIEEDLLDGIGELLNVVAGNTKTALQPGGIQVLLRTPLNEEGAPPKELENNVAPGVVLQAVVANHPLSMWIWLPGADENMPEVEESVTEEAADVSTVDVEAEPNDPAASIIVLGRPETRSLHARFFADVPYACAFVDHWHDVLRRAMRSPPMAVLVEGAFIDEHPEAAVLFDLAATWPVLRLSVSMAGVGELVRSDEAHRDDVAKALYEISTDSELWLPSNGVRTELRVSIVSRVSYRAAGTEDWFNANTLNVGPRGVFIVCYEPPPKDSEIELRFLDFGDDELCLRGAVLWARQWRDSTQLPGIGVRLEASSVGAAALDKYGVEAFADEVRGRR